MPKRKAKAGDVSYVKTIVSIDVGLKNLALCCLRYNTTNLISHVIEAALAVEEVVDWHIHNLEEQLEAKQTLTFPRLCKAVADFTRSRVHLFSAAHTVVIEHQMAPRMRCIAAALMGAISTLCPDTPCYFQLSNQKLAVWGLSSVGNASYGTRKAQGVRLTHHLCGLELPLSRGRSVTLDTNVFDSYCCPASLAQAASILKESRKKDDLADALLHNLAFAFRDSTT